MKKVLEVIRCIIMDYNNLGNSGLNVSRLCYGVMGFGDKVTTNADAQRLIDSRFGLEILDKAEEITKKYNASLPQISNAWLYHQAGIGAILSGSNKIDRLEDNLKAVEIKLDSEDLEPLDKVSRSAYIYTQWVRMIISERGDFSQEYIEKGAQVVVENRANSINHP